MTVLRQRMTEDMQVRNLSPHTQASYHQQVSLFARYFRMSPDALTPEHIRTYQIYLTNEKMLAPNSIHTAVAALRFLYRITLKKDWTFGEDIPLPKKPQKLPVVLSPEEVVHFLSCVDCNKHRVILTTCYAAGLRISEAVRLKAAAIDSARMVVRVEQGKGRKDRYVMLSPMLLEILRSYAGTTTDTGLKVRAELDDNKYPKGVKVCDAQIEALNLSHHSFDGDRCPRPRKNPCKRRG